MATGAEVLSLVDRYSRASRAALDAMEEAIKEQRVDEAAKWAAIATAYNTSLATIQVAATALRNM